MTSAPTEPTWTFFTNHAHVLICIAQQPDIRLSELSGLVGIGERAVHRIVHDLSDAGYLRARRVGRRNVYEIDLDRPLRHRVEAAHRVCAVIEPLISDPDT